MSGTSSKTLNDRVLNNRVQTETTKSKHLIEGPKSLKGNKVGGKQPLLLNIYTNPISIQLMERQKGKPTEP